MIRYRTEVHNELDDKFDLEMLLRYALQLTGKRGLNFEVTQHVKVQTKVRDWPRNPNPEIKSRKIEAHIRLLT